MKTVTVPECEFGQQDLLTKLMRKIARLSVAGGVRIKEILRWFWDESLETQKLEGGKKWNWRLRTKW